MLNQAFNEVYTKFKLHFYQEIFRRFPAEDCAKLEEILNVVSRELMPEVPLPPGPERTQA